VIEFRFAFAPAFLLLLPAFLLLLRWWRGQMRSVPPVMRYSDTRLLGGLPAGVRVRLRRLPDMLRLLVWILLVIALARPQSGSSQEVIRGRGIDIVIALDNSESMSVVDFNGLTRAQAARDVIVNFIDNRRFDRIGLVVFEEVAYYQSPPTLDYDFLRQILSDVPTAQELAGSNRTAIGMGIASATNMLRRSDAEQRVIILITDGANTAGEIDPISAAQAANAFDMRIYTIGIGTSELTENNLDDEMLQQISGMTNGRYFNALTLSDLQNVYDQIDRLERSPVQRQLNIRWQDQATFVLIAALIFLLLERVLRHTLFQTIP